jgi:hypothetical protein
MVVIFVYMCMCVSGWACVSVYLPQNTIIKNVALFDTSSHIEVSRHEVLVLLFAHVPLK